MQKRDTIREYKGIAYTKSGKSDKWYEESHVSVNVVWVWIVEHSDLARVACRTLWYEHMLVITR